MIFIFYLKKRKENANKCTVNAHLLNVHLHKIKCISNVLVPNAQSKLAFKLTFFLYI